MKVAVTAKGPNLTSAVAPRFERARYLIVSDTESEELNACDLTQCCCTTFDALITGRIGRKALHAYRAADVTVYVNAAGVVNEAIDAFRAGKLPCAVEAEAYAVEKGGGDIAGI